MAAVQLGKLKFRFKDGGIDYRWGDGEVKRVGKKPDQGMNGEYEDQYDDYADYEEENLNYGGRFADEDDYAEDDYPEDRYDDDYDEGYDDGYDDSYAEDGYDDGYADDGYDDYDPQYDDRYSDEDADDGYGEDDYEPYDDSYDGGYIDDEQENGFLQYVDENDWVTYLLLVLLPPLGIYLLWRRQRFEPVIRYSVMAASAVWFIVMIILLATLLMSGQKEVTSDPKLPTLQPTVQATQTPEPTASPNPTANAVLNGLVQPSATPITGGNQATLPQGTVVWASSFGTFYHSNQACTLVSGQTMAQTTIENAKNRSMYACPECYGGELYYATAGGDFYHLDKTCSKMVDAEMYSLEKAKAEKKEACPVCVTKTQKTLTIPKENEDLTFVNSTTKDKSGVKVWCTNGGKNYHMTSSCRGMKDAKQVSLAEALLMGKTACDTCCAVSGETVYCTKGGTYYHRNATCSGMKDASKVTIAEAMVLGKKECRTCRPVANSSSSGSSAAENTGSSSSASNSAAEEYYVYATKNGAYYHVEKYCSGMQGATKVTLKSMMDEGRPACPECCGGAGMSVYASKGGTYYHSYATCTGMTNATQGTLSEALAKGYKRCPRCWGESGSTTSGSAGSSASTATSDTVKVYATTNGKYYHTKSNCTGMKNARHITLTKAMEEGKTACPTCAVTAEKTVYSTSGGKYYHKASTCEHMDNGKKRTLAEALKMGQTACPVCMSDKGENTDEGTQKDETTKTPEKVADFKVGTSGIKVYASMDHTYYHTKSSCSKAASNLSQVALETALNYGRKACSSCCSSASETVYATQNGKYYHVSKSCAGSGAKKGTLASALAYGYSPCPYCVTGNTLNEDGGSGTYESGRSGVKVYATNSGKYYHTKQSCAGEGAAKVTLETALNYGKKACQDCCAIADRKVYAVKDSFYYHASKDCAGDNAVSGTYAHARAYGLKACPNCIGGSSNEGSNDDAPEYSDAADSSVYIDLYGDSFYYHKASKCSGAGVSGATEVTLEYAKDFGYERCPHCKPASNVE